MDISIDDKPIGYITIGLFGDDAPKTVANFRQICINGIDGRTYAGTHFHRVIDRFIIQGFIRFQVIANDFSIDNYCTYSAPKAVFKV